MLLERHPRERWAAHGSLDVAFWLEVHSRFRHESAAARKALRELRVACADGDANGDGATATLAAQQFVAAASQLCLRIRRHLNDEEDLVVPLLLEQDAL